MLVEVPDAAAALRAEEGGAEGVVARGRGAGCAPTPLCRCSRTGRGPDDAAADAADAVVLMAGRRTMSSPATRSAASELGLEVVVRVRDDDELERVLEYVDPEILLLTAERAEDEQEPLDRVLELLPDVPAGKLAIAELSNASREDVEALERAGVDAVLVTGDVEALVGDAVPDV